jgi:hypothetical protein
LEITLGHPCYGDSEWTYSDVERALQSWLTDEGTVEAFRQKFAVEKETAERAQYERLRVKFQ